MEDDIRAKMRASMQNDSSPSNSKSEDIECTYINNGVCISNQYPGHQCEPPQDNLPQEATSLDDNYQAVQKILLDWNNGRRPLSGEVRDILAWHKAEITKLLQVIEDELNKFTARHDEPMKEAAIEIIKQIKERL